jgi:hypothetical protein
MTGRMTNGSGHHKDDEPENNITSLEEARQRAKAKAREQARASGRLDRMPSTVRDRVIGGLFIVMALGMIVYWGAGLLAALK